MTTEESLSPIDDRTRAAALAAWDAGRLLNQMRFQMVQAWLLPDKERASRVENLLESLVALLRQAAPSVESGDRLVRLLDDERENWHAAFGSSDHADALVAANKDLEIGSSSSRRTATVREEVIGSLLTPVNAVYRILRNAVASELPELQRQVVAFGEAFDQGLHPPAVFRDMPYGQPARELLGEATPLMSWTGSRPVCQEWHLPTASVESATEVPAGRWFTELAHHWTCIGLTGEPPTVESSGRNRNIRSIVASIDHQVRTALSRWRLKPHWDSEKSELRVGDAVVRHVPRRAKNLIQVLSAFEAKNWPNWIENPFPLRDPKLHETLRTLNDGLQLISFHADGAGEGVLWGWQESE